MCSALNQALPLVTSYRAHGIGVHYHTIALLHPGNDVVCLFIISLFLFLPSFLPDKQTPTQIPFLLLSHLFPTVHTFLFPSLPAFHEVRIFAGQRGNLLLCLQKIFLKSEFGKYCIFCILSKGSRPAVTFSAPNYF